MFLINHSIDLFLQVCHFVPDYILEHISKSKFAPEVAQKAALRTISVDENLRKKRVQALKADQPVADDPKISVAQVPIVSSGIVPPCVLEHVAQNQLAGDEA